MPTPAPLRHINNEEPLDMAMATTFPPLEAVTAPVLATAPAAHYLSRAPQTLRAWASSEAGPIRPLRINGRLAWPVKEIRRLLGSAA